jgi:hypothetical protein
VALGAIQTGHDALNVAIGAVIALFGEFLRRARLKQPASLKLIPDTLLEPVALIERVAPTKLPGGGPPPQNRWAWRTRFNYLYILLGPDTELARYDCLHLVD